MHAFEIESLLSIPSSPLSSSSSHGSTSSARLGREDCRRVARRSSTDSGLCGGDLLSRLFGPHDERTGKAQYDH
jgi:hypothetical protein